MTGHKNQSGFTLIELAITVMIAGLLMASAFGAFSIYQENKKRAEIEDEMDTIRKALNDFIVAQVPLELDDLDGDGDPDIGDISTRSRFPCPASLLADMNGPEFGIEKREYFRNERPVVKDTDGDGKPEPQKSRGPGWSCLGTDVAINVDDGDDDDDDGNVDYLPGDGPQTDIGVRELTNEAGEYVYVGAVPVKALGLPAEYAIDPYGNRYIYGVSGKFANYDTALDTEGAGAQGSITVGSVGRAQDMKVPFVLISMGESEGGAFTAAGNKNKAFRCDNDYQDYENCEWAGEDKDGANTFFREMPMSASENHKKFYDDRILFSLVDEKDDEWWGPWNGNPQHIINKNEGIVCVGISCDPVSGSEKLDGRGLLVDGNLQAKEKVFAKNNIETEGEVLANRDIISEKGNIETKDGDVISEGGVIAQRDIRAREGDVVAENGNVEARDGTVTASRNITAEHGHVVAQEGKIQAGKDVVAEGNVTSDNRVEARGNIVTREGNIKAPNGSIDVGQDVVASGNISADNQGRAVAFFYHDDPVGGNGNDGPKFPSVNCPAGQFLTGYDNRGNPRCDEVDVKINGACVDGRGQVNGVMWRIKDTNELSCVSFDRVFDHLNVQCQNAGEFMVGIEKGNPVCKPVSAISGLRVDVACPDNDVMVGVEYVNGTHRPICKKPLEIANTLTGLCYPPDGVRDPNEPIRLLVDVTLEEIKDGPRSGEFEMTPVCKSIDELAVDLCRPDGGFLFVEERAGEMHLTCKTEINPPVHLCYGADGVKQDDEPYKVLVGFDQNDEAICIEVENQPVAAICPAGKTLVAVGPDVDGGFECADTSGITLGACGPGEVVQHICGPDSAARGFAECTKLGDVICTDQFEVTDLNMGCTGDSQFMVGITNGVAQCQSFVLNKACPEGEMITGIVGGKPECGPAPLPIVPTGNCADRGNNYVMTGINTDNEIICTQLTSDLVIRNVRVHIEHAEATNADRENVIVTCPAGMVRVGCTGSRDPDLDDINENGQQTLEDDNGYIGARPVGTNGCQAAADITTNRGGSRVAVWAICLAGGGEGVN